MSKEFQNVTIWTLRCSDRYYVGTTSLFVGECVVGYSVSYGGVYLLSIGSAWRDRRSRRSIANAFLAHTDTLLHRYVIIK